MIKKISTLFMKVFILFLLLITITGIVNLILNNSTVPSINVVSLSKRGSIVFSHTITGDVVPSIDENTSINREIEVKASENIEITNIKYHTNEYYSDKSTIFTIDSSSINEKKQLLEKATNEQIEIINLGIRDKLRSISKVLGRDITDIKELDSSANIIIKANTNGKITRININEGDRVEDSCIGYISDTDNLYISFLMTPDEYSNMYVGQRLMLCFSGYDGFYQGTISEVNSEKKPNADNSAFIYEGKIKMKNPGLITSGISASVYTEKNDQADVKLNYSGTVDKSEAEEILLPLVSSNSMNIYLKKLYICKNDYVNEGQIIAEIGGNDLKDYISDSKNDIIKDIEKRNKLLESLQEAYDSLVEGYDIDSLNIDENGNCSISADNVLITYIATTGVVSKGQPIIKYRILNDDNLYIRVRIPTKLYLSSIQKYYNKLSWKINEHDSVNLKYLQAKNFLDYFELFYIAPDYDYLEIGDKINIECFDFNEYRYVLPKTAVDFEYGLEIGNTCYVYPVKKTNSYLGKVTVVTGRIEAYVLDYDNNNVAIQFKKYSDGVKIENVINDVDRVYSEGQIVNIIKSK